MALGWILFAKGDRHVTAEMLYEEATRAKVPVSLATVYNTLHQFTEVGLLRQVAVDGSKAYFDTNNSEHHHFFIEDQNDLMDIPRATWWSARRRWRPRDTRSPASMSWCGCGASRADIPAADPATFLNPISPNLSPLTCQPYYARSAAAGSATGCPAMVARAVASASSRLAAKRTSGGRTPCVSRMRRTVGKAPAI